MIRSEFTKRSPLRILENTTHGGLGGGNIGVFAARHGEGKTACLVHFALDALLRGRKVLHVTFSESPDHIYSWYENMFSELVKVSPLEMADDIHEEISANRMIVNFSLKKLTFQQVKQKISSLTTNIKFHPEVIILDGYNSGNVEETDFREFKTLAGEYGAELWFSYALDKDPRLPNPAAVSELLNSLSPLISVIILLESTDHSVILRLLRDHENSRGEDTHLRLNRTSLLIIEE